MVLIYILLFLFQICLLWLLMVTAIAKHIPNNESSEENQRMQYRSAASMLEPTLSLEVVLDNDTTSYFESVERTRSWQASSLLSEDNHQHNITREENDDDDDDAQIGNQSSSTLETNSIQKMINILDRSEKLNETRSMERMFLSNEAIVCNDGTQAGFVDFFCVKTQ